MILSATNDAQAVAARPSSPIVFELNAGAHTRARLRDPTDTPRRMDIAEVRSVFGVPDVDSDAPRRRNRSNPREPGPAPGPRPAPACVRHASIARAGTRTPSDKSRQHPRDRLHRVHARDGVPVPATMDASRLAERVGRLNRSVTPCLCVAGGPASTPRSHRARHGRRTLRPPPTITATRIVTNELPLPQLFRRLTRVDRRELDLSTPAPTAVQTHTPSCVDHNLSVVSRKGTAQVSQFANKAIDIASAGTGSRARQFLTRQFGSQSSANSYGAPGSDGHDVLVSGKERCLSLPRSGLRRPGGERHRPRMVAELPGPIVRQGHGRGKSPLR